VTFAEPVSDLPKKRGGPAAVRVGCAALLLMSLLALGQVIDSLYDAVTVSATIQRIAPSAGASASEAADFTSDLRSYALFYACVAFFITIFLLLSAVNSWRGKRSGQVMAIVYSAPLMFCALIEFLPGRESKLEVAYGNTEPAWTAVLDWAVLALSPLALVVVIAMLTRSARQHFSWLPPAPPGYMWAPAAVPWPYQASDRPDQ
jgi:hypothetical protein